MNSTKFGKAKQAFDAAASEAGANGQPALKDLADGLSHLTAALADQLAQMAKEQKAMSSKVDKIYSNVR
jgi:uncharacterized membrane protein YccC